MKCQAVNVGVVADEDNGDEAGDSTEDYQTHSDEEDEQENEQEHWDAPESISEEMYTDPNHNEDDELYFVILSFKVGVTTPLLLVSKVIHSEVREYLRIYEIGYIKQCHNEIASCIDKHRIISSSPLFREIWSRSRIVLNNSIVGTLWFLNNIPTGLAQDVYDIVITDELLTMSDPDNVEAWNRPHGERRSFFPHFLNKKFPNLRHVALQVPSHQTDAYWYDDLIPTQVCEMLKDGEIDVVRFFYIGLGPCTETDHVFLERNVGPLSVAMSETNSEPNEEGADMVRTFHVVEEFDQSACEVHPSWKLMGARRVVRITRWADAKFESKTNLSSGSCIGNPVS
jgi:hypothetical protein